MRKVWCGVAWWWRDKRGWIGYRRNTGTGIDAVEIETLKSHLVLVKWGETSACTSLNGGFEPPTGTLVCFTHGMSPAP